MSMTDRSRKSTSTGDLTPTTPESSSKSSLCKQVIVRAIKDAVEGNDNARRDVVRWLVSHDFDTICEFAQVDPQSWRPRIAELFRTSPGLQIYYANKMIKDLRS